MKERKKLTKERNTQTKKEWKEGRKKIKNIAGSTKGVCVCVCVCLRERERVQSGRYLISGENNRLGEVDGVGENESIPHLGRQRLAWGN